MVQAVRDGLHPPISDWARLDRSFEPKLLLPETQTHPFPLPLRERFAAGIVGQD